MLTDMLELEVEDFLGRVRYGRGAEFRGYRNGHLPKRTIGVGMGGVEVRVPRVSANLAGRPGPRTAIDGLFLAGASTRSAHGVTHAMAGGVDAASAILGTRADEAIQNARPIQALGDSSRQQEKVAG